MIAEKFRYRNGYNVDEIVGEISMSKARKIERNEEEKNRMNQQKFWNFTYLGKEMGKNIFDIQRPREENNRTFKNTLSSKKELEFVDIEGNSVDVVDPEAAGKLNGNSDKFKYEKNQFEVEKSRNFGETHAKIIVASGSNDTLIKNPMSNIKKRKRILEYFDRYKIKKKSKLRENKTKLFFISTTEIPMIKITKYLTTKSPEQWKKIDENLSIKSFDEWKNEKLKKSRDDRKQFEVERDFIMMKKIKNSTNGSKDGKLLTKDGTKNDLISRYIYKLIEKEKKIQESGDNVEFKNENMMKENSINDNGLLDNSKVVSTEIAETIWGCKLGKCPDVSSLSNTSISPQIYGKINLKESTFSAKYLSSTIGPLLPLKSTKKRDNFKFFKNTKLDEYIKKWGVTMSPKKLENYQQKKKNKKSYEEGWCW